jgi:hypothetical protein
MMLSSHLFLGLPFGVLVEVFHLNSFLAAHMSTTLHFNNWGYLIPEMFYGFLNISDLSLLF